MVLGFPYLSNVTPVGSSSSKSAFKLCTVFRVCTESSKKNRGLKFFVHTLTVIFFSIFFKQSLIKFQINCVHTKNIVAYAILTYDALFDWLKWRGKDFLCAHNLFATLSCDIEIFVGYL